MPPISIAPADTEVFNIAKRIITAVIFVPILLVIILLLPAWCWCIVTIIISFFCAFELIRATGEGKVTPLMEIVSLLSAIALPLGWWLGYETIFTTACLLAVALISFGTAILTYDEKTGGEIRFYHILVTLFGGCGIPLALSTMVALRAMGGGRFLVLLAMLLAFVTDGAAYFGGVFLGKHRNVVPVSPKKSVEGYICGLVGGILLALILGLIVSLVTDYSMQPVALILCGLFGTLFTELGDLVFSLIKRQTGVKDFGKILPGHGGMLDRFDSLIFCAPVVFLIVACSGLMM